MRSPGSVDCNGYRYASRVGRESASRLTSWRSIFSSILVRAVINTFLLEPETSAVTVTVDAHFS